MYLGDNFGESKMVFFRESFGNDKNDGFCKTKKNTVRVKVVILYCKKYCQRKVFLLTYFFLILLSNKLQKIEDI